MVINLEIVDQEWSRYSEVFQTWEVNTNARGCFLTDLLILWNPHDPKGLHGFCEQILVLLSRDRDVSVGKESVVVVVFKEKLICGQRQNGDI